MITITITLDEKRLNQLAKAVKNLANQPGFDAVIADAIHAARPKASRSKRRPKKAG